jgi:hypothetical protein
LYFKFADRIIDLAQIDYTLRHDKSSEDYGSLLGALINCRHADYGRMEIPASGLIEFLHASVRNRSTSYATDEALCLATLTGLGMENISRFSGEEDRMYNFWRLLKPTPSTVAFWTGPRLKTPGRRWAPATIRGNLSLKLDHLMAMQGEDAGQELTVTERGLMLTAPGLLLDTADAYSSSENFVVICAAQGTVFEISAVDLAQNAASISQSVASEAMETLTPGRLALILKRGKRVDVAKYDPTAIDDHAVLVNVTVEAGKSEGPLYAAFLSNISVEVKSGLDLTVSGDVTERLGRDGNTPRYQATAFPDTQQWCLG